MYLVGAIVSIEYYFSVKKAFVTFTVSILIAR